MKVSEGVTVLYSYSLLDGGNTTGVLCISIEND